MAVDEFRLANVSEGAFWLLSRCMIDFGHSFDPSPMPEPTFISIETICTINWPGILS